MAARRHQSRCYSERESFKFREWGSGRRSYAQEFGTEGLSCRDGFESNYMGSLCKAECRGLKHGVMCVHTLPFRRGYAENL